MDDSMTLCVGIVGGLPHPGLLGEGPELVDDILVGGLQQAWATVEVTVQPRPGDPDGFRDSLHRDAIRTVFLQQPA
ncbi:hypothetical protein [Promicromonospora sp. NFX87]|uniref:hypothetical protein n=1 Tax=Promicromonospora sp. NFX87 TaxID=3402691 RepID=UPI003AFB3FE2